MYQYMVLFFFLATAVAGITFHVTSMFVTWITDKKGGRPKVWAYRLADAAMALLGLSLVTLGLAILASSDEGLLGLVGLAICLVSIIGGIATVIWASRGTAIVAGLDDDANWVFFAQERARQVRRGLLKCPTGTMALSSNEEIIEVLPDLGNNLDKLFDKEVKK